MRQRPGARETGRKGSQGEDLLWGGCERSGGPLGSQPLSTLKLRGAALQTERPQKAGAAVTGRPTAGQVTLKRMRLSGGTLSLWLPCHTPSRLLLALAWPHTLLVGWQSQRLFTTNLHPLQVLLRP